MDWHFVGAVLIIYGVVATVYGLVFGILDFRTPGSFIGAGCGFLFGGIPVTLLTLLVLWLTSNNRLISGVILGVIGLGSLAKTLRESDV